MLRVTNLMTTTNMLIDMKRNYQAISTASEQISSGKKINNFSDNPGLLGEILDLKTTFDKYTQYTDGITSQISRLNRSENALSQAVDILGGAREIVVKANLPDFDKVAMVEAVDKLIDEMVTAANASTGSIKGSQIFYRDGERIRLEAGYISPVTEERWITDGILDPALLGDFIAPVQVFGDGFSSDSIFGILIDLKEKLAAGNIDEARNLLEPLDEKLETTIQEKSRIGAKINFPEGLKNKLEDQQLRTNWKISN